MAARNKPYDQFGPYVLFKKFESDALGDLWRAARIENGALGPLVALRRLTGGDRAALSSSAAAATQITAVLTGTSFVRDQLIDVADGVPFIAHDYSGGRSLRHVVDRARGGTGNTPNPIPLDQAIAIAERVALSLATTADLRFGRERLTHGALIPQFIWISADGEIRVAGQQLGKGLVASLRNGAVAADIGRYFAPEYQASGEPAKASEVYSLGAILHLLVTGQEPPDPSATGAFSLAVRGAKTTLGPPLPDDIRAILEKSLVIDPAARYASVADMKQALTTLANSGRYSATTFNLAFYLSNLLKKETESEALERERENKLNLAPYLEAPPVDAPAASLTPTPSPFAAFAKEQQAEKRSRIPLIAAAVLILAAGVGAWMFFGSKKAQLKPAKVAASAPPPKVAVAIPEPIVASPSTASVTGLAATPVDDAARRKAFEDAVKAKLQQEMMKLQAEYTRELQQKQSRNAPVLGSTPQNIPQASTSVAEERGPTAAELDSQRREAAARAQEALAAVPSPSPTSTQASTPAVTTQAPLVTVPSPAAVQVPAVREGDIVDLLAVDVQPKVVREARPVYPAIAARQRIVASVLATILISEKGDVIDVKILRGDPRFGFNDAATRALRAARYTPAIKDGKRVKTWWPQIIQFNP
ncbi:MAG: TonB family protein [Thermoanaerobaculia bacterium]|nr:TonB family protein [Thermoanaerobaculia bacterium]